MKLDIGNFRIAGDDSITANVALRINDLDPELIYLDDLNVKDLDTALSGTLDSFSRSLKYKEYKLRSSDPCLLKVKKAEGFNNLFLEFRFSSGILNNGCTIWTGSLSKLRAELYGKVIGALIKRERNDLCESWASNSAQLPINSPLQVGDQVRTVVGGNVKTSRIGHVYSRSFHFKQEKHLYHLLIDGKRYKKQYFQDELDKVKA